MDLQFSLFPGIHHGVIAAETSWNSLFSELRKYFPGLELLKSDLSERADSDKQIIGGEFWKKSYLLDPYFELSDPDKLAKVAKEIPGWFISCGGESFSGTFWVYAFYHGQVRRFYWNCQAEVSQPLSQGTPFSVEEAQSLEESQGLGLYAILESVGFQFGNWYHQSKDAHIGLSFTDDATTSALSARGQLGNSIEQHRKKYNEAKDQLPGLGFTLQAKSKTGDLVYESHISTKTEFGPSPPTKSKLRRMWEALFSRKEAKP